MVDLGPDGERVRGSVFARVQAGRATQAWQSFLAKRIWITSCPVTSWSGCHFRLCLPRGQVAVWASQLMVKAALSKPVPSRACQLGAAATGPMTVTPYSSPVKVILPLSFCTLQAFYTDTLEEATMLGKIFARFVEKSPISVMVRGTLERVLGADQLDTWFAQTAQKQYTRTVLFSTV